MEQLKVDKYLNYLLEKLYIFKQNVELDISNCIDDTSAFDTNHLVDNKTPSKKIDSDIFMQKLTNYILTDFICFDVIDHDLQHRITPQSQHQLYDLYKRYKENKNQIRSYSEDEYCCTNNMELKLDPSLDTLETKYINSLDFVTTKGLIKAFGNYLFTGSNDPTLSQHRYEYKFIFRGYIYSIYDYLDENDSWFLTDDIYWHVATNCQEHVINDLFIKEIEAITK